MKAKLDHYGLLLIERNGEMKEQFCPNSTSGRCGGWCPLFGEPKQPEFLENPSDKTILLDLCCKTLVFDEFEINKRRELCL
jgi:hypothetical protein